MRCSSELINLRSSTSKQGSPLTRASVDRVEMGSGGDMSKSVEWFEPLPRLLAFETVRHIPLRDISNTLSRMSSTVAVHFDEKRVPKVCVCYCFKKGNLTGATASNNDSSGGAIRRASIQVRSPSGTRAAAGLLPRSLLDLVLTVFAAFSAAFAALALPIISAASSSSSSSSSLPPPTFTSTSASSPKKKMQGSSSSSASSSAAAQSQAQPQEGSSSSSSAAGETRPGKRSLLGKPQQSSKSPLTGAPLSALTPTNAAPIRGDRDRDRVASRGSSSTHRRGKNGDASPSKEPLLAAYRQAGSSSSSSSSNSKAGNARRVDGNVSHKTRTDCFEDNDDDLGEDDPDDENKSDKRAFKKTGWRVSKGGASHHRHHDHDDGIDDEDHDDDYDDDIEGGRAHNGYQRAPTGDQRQRQRQRHQRRAAGTRRRSFCGLLRPRTARENTFCAVISALGISLFASLLVLYVHRRPQNADVCTTPACTSVAGTLLNSRDPTADICTDFYTYSCGGFVSTHPLPSYQMRNGRFEDLSSENSHFLSKLLLNEKPYQSNDSDEVYLFNQLHDFMRTCTDTEALEKASLTPTREAAKKMLALFETESKSDSEISGLTDALATMYGLGKGPLLDISLGADMKEPSKQIFFLYPGDLSLPVPSYYGKNNTKNYREVLFKTINTTMATVLEKLPGDAAKWENIAQSILEFETRLADSQPEPEFFHEPKNVYNKMSLRSANKLIPSINLKQLLEDVFFFYNVTPKTAFDLDATEIVVTSPSYFIELNKLLSNDSTSTTIANLFAWRTIQALLPWDSPTAVQMLSELRKVVYGVSANSPRDLSCLKSLENILGFVVSHFYVEEKFPENAKDGVIEIISNMLSSFRLRLESVDWLDEPTRVEARAKVDNMVVKVGYPSLVKNASGLRQYYADYTAQGKTYSALQIEGYHAAVKRELRTLSLPSNTEEWEMLPHAINAYYDPQRNEIVFPAGILQPPFYSPELPDAANYGSLGAIVGHELSHAFDDSGRLYDSHGKMRDWWTNTTTIEYNKRASCFERLYSNYHVPGPNGTLLAVNGKLTLGENLADNAGIEQAYDAMLSSQKARSSSKPQRLPGLLNVTSGQLFMISFANTWCSVVRPEYQKVQISHDPHSPAPVRVIGTLHNSMDFVKAYNCEEIQDRCLLWGY